MMMQLGWTKAALTLFLMRRCGGFSPRRTTRFNKEARLATKRKLSAVPLSEQLKDTLVSVKQCADIVNEQREEMLSSVVFIDGSWYHKPDPTTNKMRNPAEEFKVGPRMPQSKYLDIDAIACSNDLFPELNPKDLPHMMPPKRWFALAMDAYGISNEQHIIVYARRGALFAPRVWFLFLSMGHDPNKIHVMQGSIEDYIEQGGPVEEGWLPEAIGQTEYAKFFDSGILNVTQLHIEHYHESTTPQYIAREATHICGKEAVRQAVEGDGTVILDTRSSGYKKYGHMPGSLHLPYSKIASEGNALVVNSESALKELFVTRNVDYLDANQKIILSCGSGVSVCHGFLALKLLGREITEENTFIYDASWAEWGQEDDLPKILPG